MKKQKRLPIPGRDPSVLMKAFPTELHVAACMVGGSQPQDVLLKCLNTKTGRYYDKRVKLT